MYESKIEPCYTLCAHASFEPKLKNGMTIAEIQKMVDQWVDEYNSYRPHSSLKYLTPYEKYTGIPLAKKVA